MRVRSLLAAVAVSLGAGAAAAPPARAVIAWTPCAPAGYQCGRLAVPLDPAGAAGGTLTLSIKRVVAASNPTRSAVVALAGGPGQAALPFAAKIAARAAPALATRDLVVFDQRGTGQSGRLRCRALQSRTASVVSATHACALEIGPARAFYRSAESVEDIEAIRREGGYEKLVLYGTSYGTKVATAYAARYPARVEALLLDSVVPPEGQDVFGRPSLRATGRALRELCGATRCRGITADPRGDLAALVRRTERRSLRGPVTTPRGRTARRSLDPLDLYDIVLAGDFDPLLRAELPSAVRSALRGDVRPILRLEERAQGGGQNAHISTALFLATSCEELRFPWSRDSAPQIRVLAAVAAVRRIPRAQLGPFDRSVALFSDAVPLCVGWPNAAPEPALPGPLPAVPTLILEGAADVRTTLADARALAARIGGAQLLEVPFVGHSVLGSDPSGCARAAVAAFFAGRPVAPCPTAAPQFAPTPLAPARLARVFGAGRARKTINAVRATLRDVGRLFTSEAIDRSAPPRVGTRVGGLRSGNARWTRTGVSLRRFEYVPGVLVSGFAPRAPGAATRVTVSGPAAAHGIVRLVGGGRVVAFLDGRRVTMRVRAPAPAGAVPAPWPTGFRARPSVVGHE